MSYHLRIALTTMDAFDIERHRTSKQIATKLSLHAGTSPTSVSNFPLRSVRLEEPRHDALYSLQGGGHAIGYLRWASSHCTRTSSTAEGDLPRLPCARDPVRPQPVHRSHQGNFRCSVFSLGC